jgi:3-deoxy-7-phosphoheptulonate synthase
MSLVQSYRNTINNRLKNNTSTFTVVTGPCSIYCEEETLLYEKKLNVLQEELGDSIFLVMRAFVEKSRTSHAWRGFVYQPPPLTSENILLGIKRSQELFNKCTMPLAMECIDPNIFPYLEEYLSWGFIGARTSTSTTHRILASNTTIPFGFKNSLDGDVTAAIHSCVVAGKSHCILTKASQKYSLGNSNTHIVLRGGKYGTNYDEESAGKASSLALGKGVSAPLLIDCSHGNCPNKPDDQKTAFLSALDQYIKNPKKVMGVMLESNIKKGAAKNQKVAGVSFTDPCLSFEETRELLLMAKEKISLRRHKEELILPTSYVCSH